MRSTRCILVFLLGGVIAPLLFSAGAAGEPGRKSMTVTAYCGCSECCAWERGSWKHLKLDPWNRYVREGPNSGRPYTGRTASGTKPHEPRPGLFSRDSLDRPWLIPPRLLLLPWLGVPRKGVIAADTRHYPFGCEMFVPGYGWGVVEDRGSAIQGPDRIDIFLDSHQEALEWGRRQVTVELQLMPFPSQ